MFPIPNLPNRAESGGRHPSFGSAQRPTTLPAKLPESIVGKRPGIGGHRPSIGDGHNISNNGSIGSGNWGNDNSFNDINVGGGWGLPGYGYGGWANHWNTGYVNPHYGGWYNGCWGGNWGYNGGWWAPFAVGAATWGLASTIGSWGWGYDSGYVNPYCSTVPSAAMVASPYDYSQPVVVNNYASNDGDLGDASTVQGATATSEAADASPSDAAFDAALAAFKHGDYATALDGCDRAIKLAPYDSVIHEVRALSLFALGRYPEAAATLNAVLAVAPGMDWTSMSSLYGSVNVYAQQLRKLEDFCRSNPANAAGHLVLAYHYLVGGHADVAADALEVVVANQPGDVVAKRLLASLEPGQQEEKSQPPEPGPRSTRAPTGGLAAGPEIDLVGLWKATSGQDSLDLMISEDSQFTWKAAPAGRPPVEIAGTIEAAGNTIVLVSESAGSMAGTVVSKNADAFELAFAGAPPGAKSLAFRREKP